MDGYIYIEPDAPLPFYAETWTWQSMGRLIEIGFLKVNRATCMHHSLRRIGLDVLIDLCNGGVRTGSSGLPDRERSTMRNKTELLAELLHLFRSQLDDLDLAIEGEYDLEQFAAENECGATVDEMSEVLDSRIISQVCTYSDITGDNVDKTFDWLHRNLVD